MGGGPVVAVEGLVKRYGANEALRGVTLRIEAAGGAVVGLLGPNGAGKTTLVEILEGLREPTAGSVRVLGLDPCAERRRLAERVGVQLQATALAQDLTCAETLRLFAAFHEKALPVDEVLARVGLREKARSRVRTLSGGQRQRLALGIALVNDPLVLVLDEPTAGLDPAARRALHDIVRDVKALGRLVLVTTHYIEEAEVLCDRVIMLRRGAVVADGSPFDIVGRAGGASTVWLQVEGAFDPAPLVAAGARHQGRQGEHHVFSTTSPASTVTALGRLVEAQGLVLSDLRLRRPTLEDAYLDLMAGDGDA